MQYLKDYWNKFGPLNILIVTCVSIPLYAAIQAFVPASSAAQVSLKVPDAAQQSNQVSLPDLLSILKQVAQKPAEPAVKPVSAASDPVVEAIERLDRNQQKLTQQIIDRDKLMSEQLTQFISSSYGGHNNQQPASNIGQIKTLVNQAIAELNEKVDRSGNTKEQLEDIYQDANVPQLPDPLVKGLAANPGARATIHPDHGQPVIAVTEWGVSNYGSGKQLNLIRHNGRVYGQTIIHGDQAIRKQEEQAPKPEPFRLSLGNN